MPGSMQRHRKPAKRSQRLAATDAAAAFVDLYFPDCLVAMLAGSAAQGRATAWSDLDIVVITPREG